jgi:hypothetical protein
MTIMKPAITIIPLSLFFSTLAIAVASWFVPGLLPVVHAQVQIAAQFPGQAPSGAGGEGPGAFINAFYVWALSISGILAFGIIVFGGVKYMVARGNPSGESDAKEWIKSALLGVLLLAAAYFILNIINPNLVSIGLPGLTAVNAPSQFQTPQNYTFTPQTCAPMQSGPCAVPNLLNGCFANKTALVMSGICRRESGGYAAKLSGTDLCVGPSGNLLPVSVGLFQINITDSWNQQVTVNGKSYSCSQAFDGAAIHCASHGGTACLTSNGAQCKVVNMAIYNACVTAAQEAALNINAACQLSNDGSNLSPWRADATACGF